MTVARVYVSTQDLAAGNLVLEGEEHHHLSRVLRMRPGQEVHVLDGKGLIGLASIRDIDSNRTSIVVKETLIMEEERPRLHLYQALPQGTKMDGIVQRAVELGAASLIPYSCLRSRRLDGKIVKRVERWKRIALESARVSGRPYLCEIAEPASWEQVLGSLQHIDLVIYADESGGDKPSHVLDGSRGDDIALLIGPEGGFDEAERKDLAGARARAVTLGKTVLRTETAGTVLLTAARCSLGLL